MRPVVSSADRRSAILDAATEVFAEHGYRGASLREIAKSADVSLTLIVHHYHSKALLFEAVLTAHDAFFAQRVAALRRDAASDGTPLSLRRLMDGWVLATLEGARGRLPFVRLLARARFERVGPHSIQPLIDTGMEELCSAVSRCFPDGCAEASLAACHFADAVLLDFIADASLGLQVRDSLVRFIVGGIEAIHESASMREASAVEGRQAATG